MSPPLSENAQYIGLNSLFPSGFGIANSKTRKPAEGHRSPEADAEHRLYVTMDEMHQLDRDKHIIIHDLSSFAEFRIPQPEVRLHARCTTLSRPRTAAGSCPGQMPLITFYNDGPHDFYFTETHSDGTRGLCGSMILQENRNRGKYYAVHT